MTAMQSQRWLRTRRSPRAALTLILCELLLSVTPLFAQSAPANPDPSAAPYDRQGTAVGDKGLVLSSAEIGQGAMLLRFTSDQGGDVVLKGPGRSAFEIAGADHVWFPAEAHLVNGVVVVSTSLVQQPRSVRYAWPSLKDAVLFNRAGVPAAPFHTEK